MSLVALAEELRAAGGTLGALARSPAARTSPGPPSRAASGPRAEGHEAEYELLLEMILEGSRLHYGNGEVVRTDDPDLALLLGDQLYASGLSRLAALGDLEAVAELADIISLVSQAHASGDAALSDAVWDAGAIAIGWGSSAAYREAKSLARAGDARAIGALRECATAPARS